MAGPPSLAQQTLYNILTKIGERLQEVAAPRVLEVSPTLAAALDMFVDVSIGQTWLEIPHYWALYLHDGQQQPPVARRFREDGKRLRFLVWFADPRDDPRLAGGYPVRETDIVHLTKEQFILGMEINRQRRASGGSPYMFVAPWRAPLPPNKFFEEGCAPVLNEVPEIIDAEIQSMFKTIGKEITKSDRARFKLR